MTSATPYTDTSLPILMAVDYTSFGDAELILVNCPYCGRQHSYEPPRFDMALRPTPCNNRTVVVRLPKGGI